MIRRNVLQLLAAAMAAAVAPAAASLSRPGQPRLPASGAMAFFDGVVGRSCAPPATGQSSPPPGGFFS